MRVQALLAAQVPQPLDALVHYREALALNPFDSGLHYDAGWIALGLDQKEAQYYFARAHELNPFASDPVYALGRSAEDVSPQLAAQYYLLAKRMGDAGKATARLGLLKVRGEIP